MLDHDADVDLCAAIHQITNDFNAHIESTQLAHTLKANYDF